MLVSAHDSINLARMQLLGIPFAHRSLSLFRHYDEFRAINPVVKVPTLN